MASKHSLRRSKGRSESGSFVALQHNILEHEQYAMLPMRAVKLLIDIYAQYRGSNNGDLCATWSMMKKRGWKSQDTLSKALSDLINRGWLVLTRQGGRHQASLYAVTFKGIDECGGKLDRPANPRPLNYWKLGNNPEI